MCAKIWALEAFLIMYVGVYVGVYVCWLDIASLLHVCLQSNWKNT